MKGVIFNAVERAVVATMGTDAWDDLLDLADSDGVYTALGTYPDDELIALVMAAAEMTGHDPEDVLRLIGRHSIEHLVDQMSEHVDRDGHVFDFLGSVHSLIHMEVKKLDPDARPPAILPNQLAEDLLELSYRSERGLSPLAEGLIVGSGDLFAQPVEVSVPDSVQRDGETVIHVRLVA